MTDKIDTGVRKLRCKVIMEHDEYMREIYTDHKSDIAMKARSEGAYRLALEILYHLDD